MSYTEYYDLFDKCQDTGPYHLFVFDVEGSKELRKTDNPYISQISLLIYRVYKKIEAIEKIQNRQILHHSPYLCQSLLKKDKNGHHYLENPIRPPDQRIYQKVELSEPFQTLGDVIGLTILRGTLTIDEVYSIFDQTKEELNIPYNFHYANGYYETDNYVEGGTKLYRGYAIQMLAEKQKKESNKTKRKV